jgi:hypothetical protein
MLDYLGSFPPPDKKTAVSIITKHMYTEFENHNIDINDIEFIANIEYEKFGSLGSQAAWVYCTEKLLTNNVRNALKEKLCIPAV